MITGNYWMKFIGKPGGELMKHAPGNYIHGQKYKVPFGHSKFPYWELLEEVPEFVAPDPSEADSVFEQNVYVPEDDKPVVEITTSAPLEEITITPSNEEGYNFDPNAPATIEPYVMFNTGTGETSPVDPEAFLEPEVAPEASETDMLKIEVERLTAALEAAKTTPSVKFEPDPPSRDDLLKTLADAGVEIKSGTRTTTLRKMVEDLGA